MGLAAALVERCRKVAQALPEPARRVVRTAYRSLRPPTPPVPRSITFPPDVADAEQLRALLKETDLFGEAVQEAENYLGSALERFRITMALVPELPSGARVLELGANPYFLTRLMIGRGSDVTCANWFGQRSGFDSKGSQTVTESGVAHTYEFDHFNIEEDRFPYENDTFDLVLFCEILEHLPSDPIHPLAEIHRVLRPGGTLLLTTPNATRLENLVRMIHGENVYEVLSGYGAYGRHNREYTLDELRTLLGGCGYDVSDLFAMDIGPPPPYPLDCPAINPDGRGENIFALARARGDPRWPYPDWLYSSQHALSKVVRPDVRMGYNDDLQSRGLHTLEDMDGRFTRWSGAAPVARARVIAPGGPAFLKVEGLAPPPAVGRTLELSAEAAGQNLSWELDCDGRRFSVNAPVVLAPGEQEILLRTDRTWRPCDLGMSGDARTLGVGISRVAVEN
jgi:SAM-dependent methyltransferase